MESPNRNNAAAQAVSGGRRGSFEGGLLHSTEAACRNSLHFHQRGSGKAADLSCASRPSHAAATNTATHRTRARFPDATQAAEGGKKKTFLQPKRSVPLHTPLRPPARKKAALTLGQKTRPLPPRYYCWGEENARSLCQTTGMPCSSTLARSALLSALPMAHSVRLQNDERSAPNSKATLDQAARLRKRARPIGSFVRAAKAAATGPSAQPNLAARVERDGRNDKSAQTRAATSPRPTRPPRALPSTSAALRDSAGRLHPRHPAGDRASLGDCQVARENLAIKEDRLPSFPGRVLRCFLFAFPRTCLWRPSEVSSRRMRRHRWERNHSSHLLGTRAPEAA